MWSVRNSYANGAGEKTLNFAAHPAGLPGTSYKAGTVFMATHVDGVTESLMVEWPFDRKRTREFTTITVLNQLRKRLLARAA